MEVACPCGFVACGLAGLYTSCGWVFGGVCGYFPPFSFVLLSMPSCLLICYYLLFFVIWEIAYCLLLLA